LEAARKERTQERICEASASVVADPPSDEPESLMPEIILPRSPEQQPSQTVGARHKVTKNLTGSENATDSVRNESRPVKLQPELSRTLGEENNSSGIANDSIIGNPVANSTAVYMFESESDPTSECEKSDRSINSGKIGSSIVWSNGSG